MKQYEYKFVAFPIKIGFSYEKKVQEMEKIWNELGAEGWFFLGEGNGFSIFVRQKERT